MTILPSFNYAVDGFSEMLLRHFQTLPFHTHSAGMREQRREDSYSRELFLHADLIIFHAPLSGVRVLDFRPKIRPIKGMERKVSIHLSRPFSLKTKWGKKFRPFSFSSSFWWSLYLSQYGLFEGKILQASGDPWASCCWSDDNSLANCFLHLSDLRFCFWCGEC